MTTREMTVTYTPGESGHDGSKPMICITNWFLRESGFNVNDRITVEYQDGLLVIRKTA